MAASEVRQLDLILNLKDQASKELQGIKGKLEGLEPAFQKMAVVGTAALTGIAIGVKGAIKQAVNLGESVNAVNVVFGDGAKTILEFGKNSAKAVGMANSEFNQMATITGALLKDTGKPLEEVSNMTIELTKRAADMASVFNTDVNDAMSAINQAIRGETEAIRRYAGDVTDATLETYLLSQGIKTHVEDLTQQEKRLYRVQLIMEQTKVTANDFLNTQDSLANQQRVLSSEFKNLSAQLGESFIPIIQDLITKIKPVVETFAQWVKNNPELTKNIIIATAAFVGLVAVVGALGLVLPSVITVFALLFSPISLITALIIALSAAAVWLNNKMKEWGITFTPIRNAILALFSPIMSITGLIQDWRFYVDGLIGSWEKLRDLASKGIDGTINFFKKMTGTGSGSEKSVNDAIISPKGDIITTHPDDYLIATKNPQSLAGGGGGVNVVINYPFVLNRNGADALVDVISQSLRGKLRI